MTDPSLPPEILEMSFEEALEELKTIVSRLEKGEGKLDEAIGAYERGALLKRHCDAKLREAEAKIEKISLGADGSAKTEALDVD
jgi:exodeoxyribonuclease VII small subunit